MDTILLKEELYLKSSDNVRSDGKESRAVGREDIDTTVGEMKAVVLESATLQFRLGR